MHCDIPSNNNIHTAFIIIHGYLCRWPVCIYLHKSTIPYQIAHLLLLKLECLAVTPNMNIDDELHCTTISGDQVTAL